MVLRSQTDPGLIDFLYMFTYFKLKQKPPPCRWTNVFEEASLVSGTTWGSHKHFILVLPVPKSVLQFIGAIQKRQKKGSGDQWSAMYTYKGFPSQESFFLLLGLQLLRSTLQGTTSHLLSHKLKSYMFINFV